MKQNDIELDPWPGISASNPLAFMAAVGAFRLISQGQTQTYYRLGWTEYQGSWVPHVTCDGKPLPKPDVMQRIETALQEANANPVADLESIAISADAFRDWTLEIVGHGEAQIRDRLDFLAGLSSHSWGGTERLQETDFRVSRSHEFMKFMRILIKDTTASHIEKSLYQSWTYADPIETHSMRWEPKEDALSRYALRWDNPGDGNPERKKSGSEWGANRLAIEALPWFPTMPRQSGPVTTGFSQDKRRRLFFSWPVWKAPLSPDCIRSLLAQDLTNYDNAYERAEALGVATVFRSERLIRDKYRNFSESTPVY